MTVEASIDIDGSCTATVRTYSNHDARVLSDVVGPTSPLLHEVRIQNDSTLPIAVVCRSYHQGGPVLSSMGRSTEHREGLRIP